MIPRIKMLFKIDDIEENYFFKQYSSLQENLHDLLTQLESEENLDRNKRILLLKKAQQLMLNPQELSPQQKLKNCNLQRQLIKILLRTMRK